MTDRRPLSQALKTADLPPGAMEFIRAGTPQPVQQSTSGGPPASLKGIPRVEPVSDTPAPLSGESPESPESPLKAIKPRLAREKALEQIPPRNLVTLSIRVPSDITDALLRASTERKLKRIKAHTQQEIAAEALTLWLERNGYLSPRVSLTDPRIIPQD